MNKSGNAMTKNTSFGILKGKYGADGVDDKDDINDSGIFERDDESNLS